MSQTRANPVSVNKVLLEHHHIHLFSLWITYGCFHTTMADLLQQSLYGPQGLRHYYLALYRKRLPIPGFYELQNIQFKLCVGILGDSKQNRCNFSQKLSCYGFRMVPKVMIQLKEASLVGDQVPSSRHDVPFYCQYPSGGPNHLTLGLLTSQRRDSFPPSDSFNLLIPSLGTLKSQGDLWPHDSLFSQSSVVLIWR